MKVCSIMILRWFKFTRIQRKVICVNHIIWGDWLFLTNQFSRINSFGVIFWLFANLLPQELNYALKNCPCFPSFFCGNYIQVTHTIHFRSQERSSSSNSKHTLIVQGWWQSKHEIPEILINRSGLDGLKLK